MKCALLFSVLTLGLGVSAGPCDGEIWPDDKGVHINAHGGGVMWHEGRYYWYGEHKGAGCAGNVSQGIAVHCYSSTNLTEWIDEEATGTVPPWAANADK